MYIIERITEERQDGVYVHRHQSVVHVSVGYPAEKWAECQQKSFHTMVDMYAETKDYYSLTNWDLNSQSAKTVEFTSVGEIEYVKSYEEGDVIAALRCY